MQHPTVNPGTAYAQRYAARAAALRAVIIAGSGVAVSYEGAMQGIGLRPMPEIELPKGLRGRAPHPPIRGTLPVLGHELDRATRRSQTQSYIRRNAGRWPGIGDPGALNSILRERFALDAPAPESRIIAECHEARADLAAAEPTSRTRRELTPEQRSRKQAADRARRAKQKEAA